MKEMALLFGVLLTGLGLYGYFGPAAGTGQEVKANQQATNGDEVEADKGAKVEKKAKSKTALIPALVGLPLIICGTLAYLDENKRKHSMHVAAGLALIGALLGLGRGLMKVSALWGDDAVAQKATTTTLIMGTLCLVFVGLSVRSFIAAREAREAD